MTAGDVVYSLSVPIPTVTMSPSSLAAWPNPFNPRLTVAFTVPEPGDRGFREAGRHQVSWDGRDDTGRAVAAGAYLGRVKQSGRVATGRALLVR